MAGSSSNAPNRWPVWALAGLLALGAAVGAARVWSRAGTTPALRAADALPIYLAGAAVADGEDPTTQAGLKAAYDRRGLEVRAATFSNLYPATAGVLVQPIARGTWPGFVTAWRALLLLGALLAGACGAASGVRGRWAPVAAAGGAALAVLGFPVTAECIALGQANLLVGGLMAVAMLAMARGRDEVAGVAAVLGGGLKLVPGFVALPLLAGRRWRGLAGLVVAGLVLLGVTLGFVPLDRIVTGVRATLAFQAAITPDWMNHGPVPHAVRFAGDLRHTPMLWTALLTGASALVAGRLADRARAGAVLAGGVALGTAWLGADAAAFHVLYAPLYLPALAWIAAWPLDRDAPRWSVAVAAVALLPAALLAAPPVDGVGSEARLVIAGLGVWLAAAARLVAASGGLPRPAWLALGLAVGWGLARAHQLGTTPAGPAPHEVPGGDVTALDLPDGVGHGGPTPGGGTTDGGPPPAGPGTSAIRLEAVLAPPATAALTGHLVQSPRAWARLDDPLARALSEAAPQPPAALATYGDVVRFLAWEAAAAEVVPGADGQGRRLRRTLQQIEDGGVRPR